MKTKKENVIILITKNRDLIRSFGVKSIGIFGSVVREEDHAKSDIDIFVEFEEGQKRYRNFTGLCDLLEDFFGESIDLVTKDGLSPHIGKRILSEVQYVPLNY